MPLKQAIHPFRFSTQANLVLLTGLRARDLKELLDHLKTAPPAVVYYHTHHFLKQHQFLSPEPPNDFAYWVGHVLGEGKLGEQLAAIDTVRFSSIKALQEKIVQTIEKFLSSRQSFRSVADDEEFHFMRSKSFVMPTAFEVHDLNEFYAAVEKVSIYSLYHHMFESRLRLERETNDFSNWLEAELDEKDLAKSLKQLDPYTHTLEGLRQRILSLVRKRLAVLEREVVHAA